MLRRKKHLALLKSETELETRSGPASDLDDQARGRLVRQALEALSDRDRDVLLLWDAGQSYTEIAEHTGLAVGAIGTTLSRARKRLAENYREKEEADVARR